MEEILAVHIVIGLVAISLLIVEGKKGKQSR